MLVVCCGIKLVEQFTGNEAIVLYIPTIFSNAGIKTNKEIFAATLIVGLTKTSFILGAVMLVDKVGRKPLLYASTIGISVCLFTLGLALTMHKHGSGIVPPTAAIVLGIAAICGDVAFFSVGIGSISSVLNSEIFPLRLRAQASALGLVVGRLACGLISMSFLSVYRAITVAGTFFMFSAASVAFIYFCVPETKGKSLEQMDKIFEHDKEREKPQVQNILASPHLS